MASKTAKKVNASSVLTVEGLLQTVKNQLLTKRLKFAGLEVMIREAVAEREAAMKLPKEKQIDYTKTGKWRYGQSEIQVAMTQKEQLRQDITLDETYVKILESGAIK